MYYFYSELLDLFLHNELIDIDWFINKYYQLFINDLNGLVCSFNSSTLIGKSNWNNFVDRVIEYVFNFLILLYILEYLCYFSTLYDY